MLFGMICGMEANIMFDTVIQRAHLLREAYELKKKHFNTNSQLKSLINRRG